MPRLLSAEWLRIRRYWFSWVLLAGWIIILVLQVNGKINRLEELEAELATLPPSADLTPLEQLLREGALIELDLLRADLRYPAFVGYVARLSTGWGWFLVILFAAVMGGEDFSRRTLRVILARGVRRTDYVMVRALALWLAVGLAVTAITVLAAVGGIAVHNRVTDDPISLEGLGEALPWVLRAWLTCLPFIVATLFWVVVGRSAGPAMGVGIGLHAFEFLNSLFVPSLAMLFSEVYALGRSGEIPLLFRAQIRLFSVTLGYNANVFLYWNASLVQDPLFVAQSVGIDERLLPTSPGRAVAFLAGYTVLFLGWTMWVLHRRDLTYEL